MMIDCRVEDNRYKLMRGKILCIEDGAGTHACCLSGVPSGIAYVLKYLNRWALQPRIPAAKLSLPSLLYSISAIVLYHVLVRHWCLVSSDQV